jgi:threonine synthase
MAQETFQSASIDDAAVARVIAATYRRTGHLVDPHTAVGLGAAAMHHDPSIPMVCLATAHPAKFPDAVEQATGIRPALPERLADLFDRDERYDVLPPNLVAIQHHIERVLAG